MYLVIVMLTTPFVTVHRFLLDASDWKVLDAVAYEVVDFRTF